MRVNVGSVNIMLLAVRIRKAFHYYGVMGENCHSSGVASGSILNLLAIFGCVKGLMF